MISPAELPVHRAILLDDSPSLVVMCVARHCDRQTIACTARCGVAPLHPLWGRVQQHHHHPTLCLSNPASLLQARRVGTPALTAQSEQSVHIHQQHQVNGGLAPSPALLLSKWRQATTVGSRPRTRLLLQTSALLATWCPCYTTSPCHREATPRGSWSLP